MNQHYTIEYSIMFKKLLMYEIQGVKDCSNIYEKSGAMTISRPIFRIEEILHTEYVRLNEQYYLHSKKKVDKNIILHEL